MGGKTNKDKQQSISLILAGRIYWALDIFSRRRIEAA